MAENHFKWQRRVSYADCTAGNHVYHSRYLDVLEAARGELFRALGRTFLELQEQDVIFPVIEARMRFKSMARYDDVLNIEVWPLEIGRVRLSFGHRILNQDGKLLFECETFHACTRIDGKPKALPEELGGLLRPYLRIETGK